PLQGLAANRRCHQGRAGRGAGRGAVTLVPCGLSLCPRLGQHGRCQSSDGGHTQPLFFMSRRFSRRKILKAATALPVVYARPLGAAAPPAESITPALIAAATKEGQLTWYTSADLQLAEKVGKAFEQKFTSIRVRVERADGERIFSRV